MVKLIGTFCQVSNVAYGPLVKALLVSLAWYMQTTRKCIPFSLCCVFKRHFMFKRNDHTYKPIQNDIIKVHCVCYKQIYVT